MNPQVNQETSKVSMNLLKKNNQAAVSLIKTLSIDKHQNDPYSSKVASRSFNKTKPKNELNPTKYFSNSNFGEKIILESKIKLKEILEKTKMYAEVYKYDATKPMYLEAKTPISAKMNLKTNQISEFYLKQNNKIHLGPRSTSHGFLKSVQTFHE